MTTHINIKKRLALLLAFALMLGILGACFNKKDNEKAADDPAVNTVADTLPTLTPTPSPTPTHAPEVTITPRPIDLPVITAAPGTTPETLDPIDKPAKKFKYGKYSSKPLGVMFNVPVTWEQRSQADSDTVTFIEPMSEMIDNTQGVLEITVLRQTTNQAREDAREMLDMLKASLVEQFPGTEMSSLGDNNKMLGEYGLYYNYRIPPASETAYPIRGRLFVVPVNRMLIIVDLRGPGRYNVDYLDIFRELRSTMKMYEDD